MEIGPVGSSRSWIVGGPRESSAMARGTLSNDEARGRIEVFRVNVLAVSTLCQTST